MNASDGRGIWFVLRIPSRVFLWFRLFRLITHDGWGSSRHLHRLLWGVVAIPVRCPSRIVTLTFDGGLVIIHGLRHGACPTNRCIFPNNHIKILVAAQYTLQFEGRIRRGAAVFAHLVLREIFRRTGSSFRSLSWRSWRHHSIG